MALTSVVTDRPSGTTRTISSARNVSPERSNWASWDSSRETSRPSARRNFITSRSCSSGWPGVRRSPTILFASRLNVSGAPDLASKTTTPTGEVSIRVSRSSLAFCSSRCRRALAMTSAACEANITRVSSSAAVNASSPPFSQRLNVPTLWPR